MEGDAASTAGVVGSTLRDCAGIIGVVASTLSGGVVSTGAVSSTLRTGVGWVVGSVFWFCWVGRLFWNMLVKVLRDSCSLSVRGWRGELWVGCSRHLRMSLVAANNDSRVDAVGIFTSCGNHSTVSDTLSAWVDQTYVV